MSFLSKILSLLGFNKKQTVENISTKSLPTQTKSSKPIFLVDELSENEVTICYIAKVNIEDGLFIKKLTRRPIEQLVFENHTEFKKTNGICSLTSEENARKIVSDNYEKFIALGKYIFISELAYNRFKVGLVSTTSDPYEIMNLTQTNGTNYDIDTEQIIDKYKKWDKEFGIRIIGIGVDFCECEILNKKIDYKKLSEEVFEFCPDVVEPGTETVEALEEEMKRTGRIYLWWD